MKKTRTQTTSQIWQKIQQLAQMPVHVPSLPINFYTKYDHPELLIVGALLILGIVTHWYNLFQFPYYENDEGVYMSQAWSLRTRGELSPYTYWYDHAPAGWILIAFWSILTGGFFTFGASVNSGRVLMVILHVASTLLVYAITKKLSKGTTAPVIAVLIFSLSPLAIYFQRRVLLDNVMVFWALLSLFFILKSKVRLQDVIVSGICMGVAVLTKENAIFFIPGFLYVLYYKAHPTHRIFALVHWMLIGGLIVSIYFLYAALKGELFPTDSMFGGTAPHVSLIETLQYQSSRSGGSVFDFSESMFWQNMRTWIQDDPLILFGGVTTTIWAGIMSIIRRTRLYIFVLITHLSWWAFFMRGGVVYEFYIIPVIPFFSLSIALFLQKFVRSVSTVWPALGINRFLAHIVIALVVAYYLSFFGHFRGENLFTSDQTAPQLAALTWITQELHPETRIVIDNYGYLDLHAQDNPYGVQMINAEWYWKVKRDSAVREGLFDDRPENIDVLAATPQMRIDASDTEFDLVYQAIENSWKRKTFWQDGWGVDILYTMYPEQVLTRSWKSYKENFITPEGRTIDPYQDNVTTSEGQAYGLLRAVWLDDREAFDSLWDWTQRYIQREDALFAWRWDDGIIIDRGVATDADQDIALALLFASRRWDEPRYQREALLIIQALWEQTIVHVGGRPYSIAGEWADTPESIVLNPSYLSPASYRIFAEVDPLHNWVLVAQTAYEALYACTFLPLDKAIGVLPPEWCALDKVSGQFRQSDEALPHATEYSFNAIRVPWRVALDYVWYDSIPALHYLQQLSFLGEQWQQERRIVAAYEHDGIVREAYESAGAYGGNMGYFIVVEPETAHTIYEEKLHSTFHEDEFRSYWEDKQNYYTQNMAWFGTALYHDRLINWWEVH